MPTFMSMDDYQALKKKYQAEAEVQNNPQVGEFLSGQAQYLKAAPNVVDYKNFNGPNIEETTLVKTAFNQSLTTNITENYAPGVTSTIIEVAPSIHHETNLTDNYSATYQSATENINVQKEVQNIDVTNWQATHQNLNLTVPGTLKQQVMKSGNITVDQYQAQIQHQTIKAETYTHNFDTATFDGPVNIQSSGQIHFAGDIHIGPDTTALTSPSIRAARQAGMLTPTVFGEYEFMKMQLPAYVSGNSEMQGSIAISGKYEAQSDSTVSPFSLSPTKEEVHAEISKALQDYFANLEITATNENGDLHICPSLTISNAQGDYVFSNGVMVKSLGPYYAEFQYSTDTSVKKKPFEGWEFTFTLSMVLNLSVSQKGKLNLPGSAARILNTAVTEAPEALAAGRAFLERHVIIRFVLILIPK